MGSPNSKSSCNILIILLAIKFLSVRSYTNFPSRGRGHVVISCTSCTIVPGPPPSWSTNNDGIYPIDEWNLDPRLIEKWRGLSPVYEAPINLTAGAFYTPNNLFFISTHLGIPRKSNPLTHFVEVSGIGMYNPLRLNMDMIQTLFRRMERSVAINCVGNRRDEMGKLGNVWGPYWGGAAIGNAKWIGAPLKDILAAAGFHPDNYRNPEKLHLLLEGKDKNDTTGEHYQMSVPMWILLDPQFEPMVAYKMNGEDIPVTHGYPLRAIMPGIVAARSVKWLTKIIVSTEESQSVFHQEEYRVPPPSATPDNTTYSSSPPLYYMPITSYITSHEDGDTVKKGRVDLYGYAHSGGGRSVFRVEMSQNRGATWEVTTITRRGPDEGSIRNWCWSFWGHSILLKGPGRVEIWLKAVDTDYQQQPQETKDIWNWRGYLSTAYHKITLNVI